MSAEMISFTPSRAFRIPAMPPMNAPAAAARTATTGIATQPELSGTVSTTAAAVIAPTS